MTEKEKHEYLGFDRFLQVVNTPQEKELIEIEKQYYNNEITETEFQKKWQQIVKEVLSNTDKLTK